MQSHGLHPGIVRRHHGHVFTFQEGRVHFLKSERVRSFSDLLFELMAELFGREWMIDNIECESAHPMSDWVIRHGDSSNVTPHRNLFDLAYDLWVIRSSVRLQSLMVTRLRNCREFQGVRFELAVASLLTLGGISIEFDEAKPVHRVSRPELYISFEGVKISIEAKSKQRPGIMRFSGEHQHPSSVN